MISDNKHLTELIKHIHTKSQFSTCFPFSVEVGYFWRHKTISISSHV